MNENIIMQVGLLSPFTTTVDSGNHFRHIEPLIECFADEEFSVSIYCNKWLLTKMLELKEQWNDDAKQVHALLHKQLSENIKSENLN